MEDVLKRLLSVEMAAETRVEAADETRKRMVQTALDEARALEADFEREMESRRKPFLVAAEDGAQRRVDDMHAQSAAVQRQMREKAAVNEEAAIATVLAMVLGEISTPMR